ncbi:Sensor histidine kinase MctS [Nymphon striatum]|nr:Sensor histidine kinase MctS [Nymphon striatum]
MYFVYSLGLTTGIDSTKTFDFAHEALKISNQNRYGKGIVDANFTLGRALMYIDQQKAAKYLEKGYDLANKLIKSDSSIPLLELWANGTYNLGLTYGTLGKHQKEIEFTDKIIPRPKDAVKSLDEILHLVENDEGTTLYGIIMQRYAKAYEAMNDFKSATPYHTKYIESARKMQKDMFLFQGLYKRSEHYASMANYENAYEDLLQALDIYDSLETVKTLVKLDELNLKYETAQNEKEILELKVKNEEKKSQAYLLGGIVSILSLLLFAGYYVYSQRMRKARKKEREQVAEVQLLKQEQQNKIFSAMIEGQEKERKRLAIDLHDGLGGRLSGISMNLSKLDKDEPKEYPKKQLQKVMKDLNDSLTELRNVARNMMPETLVKFGLQAALKDYCSSMTGSETKVTLQFYGSDKGININQQVTMYRVIQELINNAIKHAKASEVLVQYMREGSQVDITVEDNGIGFDKSKSLKEKDSGMGLSNLQTRVAYLKGNIDFESEENEGTTVNVNINIDAA